MQNVALLHNNFVFARAWLRAEMTSLINSLTLRQNAVQPAFNAYLYSQFFTPAESLPFPFTRI